MYYFIDEAHLNALLGNLSKLREVKGRLESSSLSEVVGQWVELYVLLTDNLVVKHSWKQEDFNPPDSCSEVSVGKTPVTVEEVGGVTGHVTVEEVGGWSNWSCDCGGGWVGGVTAVASLFATTH